MAEVDRLAQEVLNVMRRISSPSFVPSEKELLNSLLTAARKEGADQMRANIMAGGTLFPRMSAIFSSLETKLGIVTPENAVWVVEDSVLNPKEVV